VKAQQTQAFATMAFAESSTRRRNAEIIAKYLVNAVSKQEKLARRIDRRVPNISAVARKRSLQEVPWLIHASIYYAAHSMNSIN